MSRLQGNQSADRRSVEQNVVAVGTVVGGQLGIPDWLMVRQIRSIPLIFVTQLDTFRNANSLFFLLKEQD